MFRLFNKTKVSTNDLPFNDFIKKTTKMYVDRLDTSGAVVETIQLDPLFAQLRSFSWIRNKVGCHFNLDGQEVSDSDVRKFGQAVVDFANAIICKTGKDLPKKGQSGSYWESKAGHSRLYPLLLN